MSEQNIVTGYAQAEDLPDIMRIYECARKYMRDNGNPFQWVNGYPSKELLLDDIEKRQLYVMRNGQDICGVFALIIGPDPTYEYIEDGSWISDSEYGTIHRIASDGSVNGIMDLAVTFCGKIISHLRVDTHEANIPMQQAVLRNGFKRCGIIYIADGTPRIAYEKTSLNIRIALACDAEAIRNIYAPYVTDTAITFEYDVPDTDEFAGRIGRTLKRYPYLVAEENGEIVGYAYAGYFRPRAAYQHTVEVSIYVAAGQTGKGIGRQLYHHLERILIRQNVFVLYACITKTEREDDEYLTDGSILFHGKMGYETVGSYYHCGYKFGRWYSMIWMEKRICDLPEEPDAFIPYPEL